MSARRVGRAYLALITSLVLVAGGCCDIAGARPTLTASPCSRPHVLFCDDFNGTTLDSSKWVTNWYGGTGPVNGAESACYSPSHVTVSKGALNLKLTEDPSTCKGATRPETTGIVTTLGKYTTPATNYRLLFRAYVPGDASGNAYNWVALWTDGTGTWPHTGENDALETLSGHDCYHYHSDAGGPGGCVSAAPYVNRWVTYRVDVVGGTATYYYGATKVGSESVVQAGQTVIIGNQGSGPYGGPRKADVLRVKYALVQGLS